MPRLTVPDALLDTPLARVMEKVVDGQEPVAKDISYAGLATSLGRAPTRFEWRDHFESNMAQIRQGTITVLPANGPTAKPKSKPLPPSGHDLPAAKSWLKENTSRAITDPQRVALSADRRPLTPEAAEAAVAGKMMGPFTQPAQPALPFTHSFGNAQANAVYLTKSGRNFEAADLPTAPQGVVDFGAGLGDALLLGAGSYLRDVAGVDGGVDMCSDAYKYGSRSSFLLGAGRLAYAGVAKAGSVLAASGAEASAFRHALKSKFRLGAAKDWRLPDLSKYPTDDALRAASGRTNLGMNAYGAGVAAAGAVGKSSCD